METKITATELARNLSDILNRVRYKGESFRIERNGEFIAEIKPAAPDKAITVAEFVQLLKSLPKPDPGFWDDVEEAHRLMNGPLPEPPPWDS
jgi:antitoxin (DNA-binding transcriptional repressor) of toxin-antitoxin stability system